MKIFTLERREKQKTFKDEKKSIIFFVRSVYVCVMRSSQLTFCSTDGCGFLQPNPKIGICRNIFPGVNGSGNLRIKTDFRVESFSVTFRAEHHNSVDADVSLIFHWQSFVTSEREKDYS